MAEKIEIVQVNEEGEVTKTHHDDFPGGWMTARTEFGKMRNSDAGAEAKALGEFLESWAARYFSRRARRGRRPLPARPDLGGIGQNP